MTTVINNNVIKISTKTTPTASPAKTSTNPEYPKTCDYCRDTYNSELTYNRHKDTGKCFRFCRLREEKRTWPSKPPKRSIYPRVCGLCSKIYKNKYSYYKHKKYRCTGATVSTIEIDPTLPPSDVDVVELAKKDIENIPILDNKENIDDFSSNFILTLDVDNNYSEILSLYPRICEICHQIFKTEELFESHKLSPRCSESGTKKKLIKAARPVKQAASRFFPCKKCGRIIHHKLLYNNHIKRCGKPINSTPPVLKKSSDFVAAENTRSAEQPNSDAPATTEFSPLLLSYFRRCSGCKAAFDSKSKYYRHRCTFKAASEATKKSMYPRTCEYCGFVLQTKVYFLRHKPGCPGYQDELLEADEDSYVSCDFCSTPFDSLYLYRQHMRYVHPDLKKVQVPEIRKYKYPRKCLKCFNVYMSRQTFCNHKKKCALSIDTHIMENVIDEPEIRIDENAEKPAYPRTCNLCQRTYSNRQSFCNHKRLCSDFIGAAKETTIYPRRCEFCLKLYSSKQTYHHHKPRCIRFNKNFGQKPSSLYPRTCEGCNCTFAYKQVYFRHAKKCFQGEKIVSEEENDFSDGNVDHTEVDLDSESKSKRNKLYPRMCTVCRRIYANRYTFCKHKQRCISTAPFVDTFKAADSTKPPEEPVAYPKECENCLGTFKNADTFNAHKIRCDFFDTKINETEYNANFKSNCEHCRNIVGQYRRILHQHLAQCTDPIVVDFDPLSVVEQNPPPIKPELSEEANFCECCGVFFETGEQLDHHKRSLQAESSLFRCDICMETFDVEEELTDHKSRCVLNTANRTYPRFCECCRKIYKTKQTFYNHKKNCHVHCLKYFVLKDCENCKLPFKCEKMYFEHVQTCVGFDNGAIAAECEVITRPEDEKIADETSD